MTDKGKDNALPFFLFLGDGDREGVTSRIRACGLSYKKKRLESGVENWLKIFELLGAPNLAGVIVKLGGSAYRRMAHPECREMTVQLFERISELDHIVFVHESIITGVEGKWQTEESDDDEVSAEDEYMDHLFSLPSEETRAFVHEQIYGKNINLAPYKKNIELSVLATEFVEKNEKNLVFRVYLPAGQMWSAEAEKLLQLFREYLGKVSGLKVRQEQYSTNSGVVYELVADKAIDPAAVAPEFENFANLLDLCAIDPERAVEVLMLRNIEEKAVYEIVERYSKEARRLLVDLKHERERRILSIRHRMESEFVDIAGVNSQWEELHKLVDAMVPKVGGVSVPVGLGILGLSSNTSNVVMNINPQFINSVEGIVAREISGTILQTAEASQLLELIGRHGGENGAELKSSLYELEDSQAKLTSRLSAKHKLKAFLAKVADKSGDLAVGVLQSYLESKMGLQ